MLDVWVAGAAMTRVGKRTERLQDLMAEAAHGALRAAGVEAPDAIVVAAMNPEEFLGDGDRKSTRLNSSHLGISYAVFCLKKKKTKSGRAGDPSRVEAVRPSVQALYA